MSNKLISIKALVEKHSKNIEILADKLQDTFLKTKNVVLKKQIAAKQAVKNREHKLISTIEYTPEQIENNSSSQSQQQSVKNEPKKVASFTIVAPAVLARIKKKQQEERIRKYKPIFAKGHSERSHIQSGQIKNNSPSQSIKYCIKCNEELEIDAQFCSECGIEQKLKDIDESNFEKYNNAKMDIETHKDESLEKITEQKELKPKNDNIKDKFFEAAKQSKIRSDVYILMNEFALTLKKLGVEWKDSSFKNFLENYKDIIELKVGAPHYALAIKIIPPIPRIPEKFEFLEQKLKEADKTYIDTCSLMETPIEKFFEKANLILKKYNKKIIVPTAVDSELKRIAKSKKYEPDVQIRAKNALEVLYPEINEIEINGEDSDNERTADQVFKYTFEKYRNKYKMLLISQDSKLSDEILNINNSKSVHGKKCEVCRIDKSGYLKPSVSSSPADG